MIQFYAPNLLTAPLLPHEEGAHCLRVLRHGAGDEIYVTDGKGYRYKCVITDVNAKKNHVALKILSTESFRPHWGCSISLAVAPTKNADRMEWMVEKGVEIGVDRIYLIICQHSERKIMRTARLEKIAISAMKQSLKTTLPEIITVTAEEYFKIAGEREGQKFIAHCERDMPRLLLSKELVGATRCEDYHLAIGPEGDFTSNEIDSALKAGFKPVSMGESRLRTETAAIFGLSAIHTAIQAKS